tara:strand:- start:525 stop:1208 length:684 start_codon:yes stop_codon:yes gene_type:complete
MAKKNNKTEDQFAQIEETLSKTEQYIEDNQKNLITIVGSVVLIIALFIGYQNLYIAPMEKEAQSDMFMAELYFQKDSFNLSLEGDGQYLGFVDIANEYSSTKAGSLANYYAGLAYLNLGDFENAIDYLGDFSSNDLVLSALALGCIGDAYMELADSDNALSYYEDASEKYINEFTTPRYMFKQAMIHETNGDVADALALYKIIEADYKASREGNGIEKYIARAEKAL